MSSAGVTVATSSGPRGTPQADGDQLPSVPAMPSVAPHQLYRGTPYIVLDGPRHSAGWQDDRKAGPGFVVTTRSALGSIKVVQRFPLSEQGWADGWQLLSRLDASAAAQVAARLAELAAGERSKDALAAAAARSSCYLPSVSFDGASDAGLLAKRQRYDLRFQDDRILICTPNSAHVVVELPYGDVEDVEVSGAARQPASSMLLWISGLGLLGAFFGFLFHRTASGLLVGAVVLGLVGGLLAALTSTEETIVRIRGRDAELQFREKFRRAHEVRRELSEPLTAIRKANAGLHEPSEPAETTSDSVADQLSKLASLLQQELITRDEFEHLKARLIADS
jgi:hypothetical protein